LTSQLSTCGLTCSLSLGLIDYYDEFLSSLHATNADRYEVVGVGHEGHSPDRPLSFLEALQHPNVLRTRPMPSLGEQVARKIAYVDQIRSAYPDEVKLVLIGHSVGAYICQEVGKDCPSAVMSTGV
jgi:pimeloyl-ACP methyl ester carboxylesterase